jgi:helix-turn-helix protein
MSDANESVVADFRAGFALDGAAPTEGRVVLSERRLVLATGDGRETIPLSAVFDVRVGDAPPAAAAFLDQTVTVGFRRDDDRHAAHVAADEDVIDRFSRLLYTLILDGTTAAVRHPARVGGRVTDADVERVSLGIAPGEVRLGRAADAGRIALDDVVHFERETRTVEGRSRPVLSIRHVADGRAATTELSVASTDALNVLGRYVRSAYAERAAAVRDLDLSEAEAETLVGLYSGGSAADLASLTGLDAGRLSVVLDRLVEAGLVTESESGPSLTARGRMAVSDRIEAVND